MKRFFTDNLSYIFFLTIQFEKNMNSVDTAVYNKLKYI